MLNDFQIVMLASGSKGNAALISTAKQRFLVDIGISCRALTTRMKEIGVSVNELDGVFITHEHVDHVRGLATFLKIIRCLYIAVRLPGVQYWPRTAVWCARTAVLLTITACFAVIWRCKASVFRMMPLIRTDIPLRAAATALSAHILRMRAL